MTVQTPYYAPEFSLSINDEPIPAALRASISSVTFQTGLEGADRVELTLVNENLRWLDHKLLALDNKLTLKIGYAPDTLEQLFVGNIVGQTASFPSGGIPTLTIVAQDRFERLQRGNKMRWFQLSVPLVGNFPILDPAVASIVSLENGLLPVTDPVSGALAAIVATAQAVAVIKEPDLAQKLVRRQVGQSDYDFLRCIALENGWEMMIDHTGVLGGHKLRFRSLLSQFDPDVTLTYGRSLVDFTPRISDVGQIVSVTVYIWVSPLKTEFTLTVGWDWDRQELTIDILPGLIPMGQGDSEILIDEPVTLLSAPRRIIKELIPRLNSRLTGTGNTIGEPRILAGTVLRLNGLGVQFGGLYRVTSATHTLNSSGYLTSFEVRKEIWFGAIPLPEQGAAPVIVPQPAVAPIPVRVTL